MAKTATEFEKIIHADRARKKNEALAAKIFNKERRASTPVKANGAGPLASRAGVTKRVASTSVTPRPSSINTEWTHDLHDETIPRGPKAARAPKATPAGGSLAARITRPGEAPRGKKAAAGAAVPAAAARGTQRRAAQVARALIREEQSGGQQKQRPHPPPQQPRAHQQQQQQQQQQQRRGPGLSIRGLAAGPSEPLVVMAQNFAPGTTAADIESAMTPVGGLVASCRLVKTAPLVIAEIVFESREGAERAIATFHNQTADGRVLQVYEKLGASPTAAAAAAAAAAASAVAPTGPRALAGGSSNGNVVDGSQGFDDPMDTDGFGSAANGRSNGYSNGNGHGRGNGNGGRLYSDDLVGSPVPTNGFGAGRRGRGRGGRRR